MNDTAIEGAIDYEHRITEMLSAWANGSISHNWNDSHIKKEILGGVRLRF